MSQESPNMATDTRATKARSKIPRLEDYPDGDGKPMAETPIHVDNITKMIEVLRAYYADDPMVWVAGNMFVYYEEGNPRKVLAPDLYVSKGVPHDIGRRVYFTWVEGKGLDFVIEMTSPSTHREDLRKKYVLYRDVLKVREYILFDPLEEYLKPSLQGHRLVGSEYLPIEMVDGKLHSEVLNLNIAREGKFLRLSDPATGSPLLTGRELYETSLIEMRRIEEEKRAAEVEKRVAEEEKRVAEEEKRVAEEEKRAAEVEKREAEAVAARAEAECERLRREIEALRRQGAGS
jgi:Uma2 family endonuclease